MFSFLLGLIAAFALAIYKPELFAYAKEQSIALVKRAGVEAPVVKSDE